MSKTDLVTKEAWTAARHLQLMSVFTRVDSTLVGRRITCNMKEAGSAPAYSDAQSITFNPNRLPDIKTVEGLVTVNGLNYHELAHVLYTPQAESHLHHSVVKNAWFQAFNILEDQRIETLLTAKYPATIPYLTATVATYFMDENSALHEDAWPILFGRKYLPVKMRRYFKKASEKGKFKDVMPRMEAIIAKYRLLNVLFHSDEALRLVHDFHDLITESSPIAANPFGHGAGDKRTAQGDARNNAQNTEDLQKAEKKDGEVSQSGAEGEGDATATGSGEGKSEGGAGDSKTEGDGDSSGEGTGKDGKGTSHNTDDRDWNPDNLISELGKLTSEITSDAEVQEAVTYQRQALGVGRSYKGVLDNASYREVSVSSPAIATAASAFGRQLSRLVADSDPAWETRKSSGRVNVKNVISGADRDSVFDTWDAGKQDADSIEMVILCDVSSSMSSSARLTMEAMWAIKYGTEKAGRNAQVSVLCFSSESYFIYRPGEKAKPNAVRYVGASGSTNASKAFEEAARIFTVSQRHTKILIALSDGQWETRDVFNASLRVLPDDMIARMNSAGIHTAYAFLDNQGTYFGNQGHKTNTHGAQSSVVLRSPADLVPFGRQIVTKAMKSR